MDHGGCSSPNHPSRSVARQTLARISPAIVRVVPASETGYARRWYYHILHIGIETEERTDPSVPGPPGKSTDGGCRSFCEIRMKDPAGGDSLS